MRQIYANMLGWFIGGLLSILRKVVDSGKATLILEDDAFSKQDFLTILFRKNGIIYVHL